MKKFIRKVNAIARLLVATGFLLLTMAKLVHEIGEIFK
jgi:hypothetical protein